MLFNSWKKHTPSAGERAQHSSVTLCVSCGQEKPIVSYENEFTRLDPRCLECTARVMREYLEVAREQQKPQAAD